MAWRAWTRQLERFFGGEARRRQALADVQQDVARTLAAMMLRTLGGEGGPLAGVSLADATKAFADRPDASVGVARLLRFAELQSKPKKGSQQ